MHEQACTWGTAGNEHSAGHSMLQDSAPSPSCCVDAHASHSSHEPSACAPSPACIGLRILALAAYRTAPFADAAAANGHAAEVAAPTAPDYMMQARCYAACFLAGIEAGPAGPHSMGAAALCNHLQQSGTGAWKAVVAESTARAALQEGDVDNMVLHALADGGALCLEQQCDQRLVLQLNVAGLEAAATHAAATAVLPNSVPDAQGAALGIPLEQHGTGAISSNEVDADSPTGSTHNSSQKATASAATLMPAPAPSGSSQPAEAVQMQENGTASLQTLISAAFPGTDADSKLYRTAALALAGVQSGPAGPFSMLASALGDALSRQLPGRRVAEIYSSPCFARSQVMRTVRVVRLDLPQLRRLASAQSGSRSSATAGSSTAASRSVASRPAPYSLATMQPAARSMPRTTCTSESGAPAAPPATGAAHSTQPAFREQTHEQQEALVAACLAMWWPQHPALAAAAVSVAVRPSWVAKKFSVGQAPLSYVLTQMLHMCHAAGRPIGGQLPEEQCGAAFKPSQRQYSVADALLASGGPPLLTIHNSAGTGKATDVVQLDIGLLSTQVVAAATGSTELAAGELSAHNVCWPPSFAGLDLVAAGCYMESKSLLQAMHAKMSSGESHSVLQAYLQTLQRLQGHGRGRHAGPAAGPTNTNQQQQPSQVQGDARQPPADSTASQLRISSAGAPKAKPRPPVSSSDALQAAAAVVYAGSEPQAVLRRLAAQAAAERAEGPVGPYSITGPDLGSILTRGAPDEWASLTKLRGSKMQAAFSNSDGILHLLPWNTTNYAVQLDPDALLRAAAPASRASSKLPATTGARSTAVKDGPQSPVNSVAPLRDQLALCAAAMACLGSTSLPLFAAAVAIVTQSEEHHTANGPFCAPLAWVSHVMVRTCRDAGSQLCDSTGSQEHVAAQKLLLQHAQHSQPCLLSVAGKKMVQLHVHALCQQALGRADAGQQGSTQVLTTSGPCSWPPVWPEGLDPQIFPTRARFPLLQLRQVLDSKLQPQLQHYRAALRRLAFMNAKGRGVSLHQVQAAQQEELGEADACCSMAAGSSSQKAADGDATGSVATGASGAADQFLLAAVNVVYGGDAPLQVLRRVAAAAALARVEGPAGPHSILGPELGVIFKQQAADALAEQAKQGDPKLRALVGNSDGILSLVPCPGGAGLRLDTAVLVCAAAAYTGSADSAPAAAAAAAMDVAVEAPNSVPPPAEASSSTGAPQLQQPEQELEEQEQLAVPEVAPAVPHLPDTAAAPAESSHGALHDAWWLVPDDTPADGSDIGAGVSQETSLSSGSSDEAGGTLVGGHDVCDVSDDVDEEDLLALLLAEA